MLAGLGRTRRVLMGDTLLEQFSPDEIEVIFAHEIGHHVHRHIPKMIATGVVISVVGFWLVDRVLVAWSGVATRGRSADEQPAAGDVFADGVSAALGAAAKRDQPALRTAMRSLRAGAHRAPRRLSHGIQKLARLNKDDPAAAPARGVSVAQPSADRGAAGDGARVVRRGTNGSHVERASIRVGCHARAGLPPRLQRISARSVVECGICERCDDTVAA